MAGSWRWLTDGPVRLGVTTSRREHTTSTLVLAGTEALLIDPAWDPDELAWIADDLRDGGITVAAGFATHAHHDHLLWHPWWRSATRWASVPTARVASQRRGDLIAALGAGWPEELTALVGTVTPTSEPRLPWAGPPIELITHDGHAAGHTALWVPAARALIAGDMLSDIELPLLEESSAADYAVGLDVLRPWVDRAELIVPGHGSPTIGRREGRARWAADRRYLDAITADTGIDDPRLDHPGMREAHAHNRSRARA
jgi:glyoxylase-like metal-dependent hydrolase (beta-lactamase superfamily II)